MTNHPLTGPGYRLILGDCIDIMKGMDDKSVDAIITDPPYGIGFKYATYDDTESSWYDLMHRAMPEMLRIGKTVILPSCAIKRLPWWYANFPPDWVIAWHKGSPGHQSAIGFNDWEPHLIWGRPRKAMHDYFSTQCGFDDNGHPCPKPIKWARWLVSRATSMGNTVLDPFAGSGTTGVACLLEGRNFIGVEMDSTYIAIAAKRMANTAAQPRLIPDEPELPVVSQAKMFA